MLNIIKTFVVGALFKALINLASVIILSKIIGPAETGKWITIYAVVAILLFILEMGQNSIILKNKEAKFEVMGFFIFINFITIFMLILIYGTIAFLKDEFSIIILSMLMISGLSSIANILFLEIQINEKFYKYQLIPIFVLTLGLIFSIFLSIFFNNYLIYFAKFIFEGVLSFIIAMLTFTEWRKLLKNSNLLGIRYLKGDDLILALGEFIYKSGNQLDKVIFGKITTLEILGSYTRCQSLTVQGTSIVASSINPVIFQYMSKYTDERKKQKLLFTYYLNIGILGGILYYFFGDIIVSFIFGSDWLTLLGSTNFLCLFPMNRALENYFYLKSNILHKPIFYVATIACAYIFALLTVFYSYWCGLTFNEIVFIYTSVMVFQIVIGLALLSRN